VKVLNKIQKLKFKI